MVIRCKGFYFDVDESFHVCTGNRQADEQLAGKTGEGNTASSGAKKKRKKFQIFSRDRGGGVSKGEKVATRNEGAKDLNVDDSSKKSAVAGTVDKAKAEERTRNKSLREKSVRVKALEWDPGKSKERLQEQQKQKSEKCDQLVPSPAGVNSNHGTRDIYIDNIPRKSAVITGDKGNLKGRNGEERTNTYVVSSSQGGSNEILYAKESPHNQKKNETERSSTLVLRTRLHCDDCIRKIRKYISKCKGVESVAIDASNDQVSVTGAVEIKEVVSYLKDKIKRTVEVVSTRKGVEKQIKEKVDKAGLGGALYDVDSRYGVLSSHFNFLIFYHNCHYPTIPS